MATRVRDYPFVSDAGIDVALAVPAAELPWKRELIVRGVESLPVRW